MYIAHDRLCVWRCIAISTILTQTCAHRHLFLSCEIPPSAVASLGCRYQSRVTGRSDGNLHDATKGRSNLEGAVSTRGDGLCFPRVRLNKMMDELAWGGGGGRHDY